MSDIQPDLTEDQRALARTSVTAIVAGKVSLADVIAALASTPAIPEDQTLVSAPPQPLAITEAQKAALARLPEIYGRVAPTENRLLSPEELVLIVEEREVIDQVLAFTKTRKEGSIREALANHLDHIYLAEHGSVADVPIDKKGHVQVKQEIPVSGTDRKIQKTVSDPKPVLSMAAVEQAHQDGLIDRPTYLRITKLPEVPRVLDESGLTKAVKADPSLLFTLAGLTTKSDSTTTIKVAKA